VQGDQPVVYLSEGQDIVFTADSVYIPLQSLHINFEFTSSPRSITTSVYSAFSNATFSFRYNRVKSGTFLRKSRGSMVSGSTSKIERRVEWTGSSSCAHSLSGRMSAALGRKLSPPALSRRFSPRGSALGWLLCAWGRPI